MEIIKFVLVHLSLSDPAWVFRWSSPCLALDLLLGGLNFYSVHLKRANEDFMMPAVVYLSHL